MKTNPYHPQKHILNDDFHIEVENTKGDAKKFFQPHKKRIQTK